MKSGHTDTKPLRWIGNEVFVGSTDGFANGAISTFYGNVSVYIQGYGESRMKPLTRLGFTRDGIVVERTFLRNFTTRGLVTKANQFVQDVMDRKEVS